MKTKLIIPLSKLPEYDLRERRREIRIFTKRYLHGTGMIEIEWAEVVPVMRQKEMEL